MIRLFLAVVTGLFLTLPQTALAETPAEKTMPQTESALAGKIIGPAHAMAMHGTPKYPADFTHFDYVNPDAPKGGTFRYALIGTFDSLNSYILRGNPAAGIQMMYQTLLEESRDEPFTEYGNLAESFEMAEDRSWVRFKLRKQARWHDGKPLTAEDVKWSFETLMEKGHPFYRSYYANVAKVEIEDPHSILFSFNVAGNRELPLIIGQLPVLPKHYWEGKDFGSTTLEPPLGSGPYKIIDVKPGQSITYERVKDWWAKDIPVNKGRYNFDTFVFTYYRDQSVAHQAFLSGEYDFVMENIARTWETGYDAPPVKDGRIVKREQAHELPRGMQAFIFNTRRPVFAEIAVREAVSYAFDFEWSNKQFAHGSYKRTTSFFSNSELASSGLPEGKELDILQEFRGQIPEEVFTKEYKPPATDGSGTGVRKNLRTAAGILEKAGWVLNKETGMREKNGIALSFELLLISPAFERWAAPFIKNLERIGIKAVLRIVDASQYQERMDGFDFDMIISTFGQSLSPGNEQRDFWHSEKADIQGSRNLMGIKNPVIDALIDQVIHAPDRETLVASTHALDRVLLWNHYVIPQWHLGYFRMAYWDKFGFPKQPPKYDSGVQDTWWIDAEKAAKLKNGTGQ